MGCIKYTGWWPYQYDKNTKLVSAKVIVSDTSKSLLICFVFYHKNFRSFFVYCKPMQILHFLNWQFFVFVNIYLFKNIYFYISSFKSFSWRLWSSLHLLTMLIPPANLDTATPGSGLCLKMYLKYCNFFEWIYQTYFLFKYLYRRVAYLFCKFCICTWCFICSRSVLNSIMVEISTYSQGS